MTNKERVAHYLNTHDGKGSASDIIKATKLPRTAVYNALSALKREKQFINHNGTWMVSPECIAEAINNSRSFRDQQTQAMVPNGGCPASLREMVPAIEELGSAMRKSGAIEVTLTLTESGKLSVAPKMAPQQISPFEVGS